MATRLKDKSLPSLIQELDIHFSRWIRNRDLPGGVGRCFICGNRLKFSEAHCGHWENRDRMPTRYDDRNCHAICQECNMFDVSHRLHYSMAMVVKYGKFVCEEIETKSRSLQKFTRHELEELIAYYKSENRLNRTKV